MAKENGKPATPKHLDPTSDYYLSHQANSGIPLTKEPLNGDNYITWCTYYSRVGHTREKCYRRLGIVPQGKGRGMGRGAPFAPATALANATARRASLLSAATVRGSHLVSPRTDP